MHTRSENMELLFDRLAQRLLAELENPECPPAVLGTIVKFLQNNEITAIPTDDSSLGELQANLPEELWEKLKTPATS